MRSSFSMTISDRSWRALRDFVADSNDEHYHESLDNVTPAEACFCRKFAGISEREKIKRRTMRKRKSRYLAGTAAWVETTSRHFATSIRRVKYLDDVQTNA